jgi:hypothetical protein
MKDQVILAGDTQRQWACQLIGEAQPYSVVTIRAPTRSTLQNARLWAMLSDVAVQVEWHGLKLSSHDWKDMFTAALRKARIVPGLDGAGFVALGLRTSQMTVAEMGDLMTLMEAFGAEKGVVWSEPEMPP